MLKIHDAFNNRRVTHMFIRLLTSYVTFNIFVLHLTSILKVTFLSLRRVINRVGLAL